MTPSLRRVACRHWCLVISYGSHCTRFSVLTMRSLHWPRSMRITPCSAHCSGQALNSPPGSLSPLANSESASTMPPNCRSMPASPQSQNAVDENTGYTGAGGAQPSFVRHPLSGRLKRSISRSGPVHSTVSNMRKTAPTRPLYVPWHSNGSVFSSVAGKHERHTGHTAPC